MARIEIASLDARLAAYVEDVPNAPDFEAALRALNEISVESLGDGEAAERPGALRPGERNYRVAGAFLITPDRKYNMLVGAVGFPPEQRRLMIPLDWNDPGWVVANERELLVANTDQHVQFRQFLKSSRMGSSIYAPIWARTLGRRAMVGQMVAAAQARGTYDKEDLERLARIAALAGDAFEMLGGEAWLSRDYPAPDAWRADRHARLDNHVEPTTRRTDPPGA